MRCECHLISSAPLSYNHRAGFPLRLFLCCTLLIGSLFAFPLRASAEGTGIDRYPEAMQAIAEGQYDVARRLLLEIVGTTPAHAGAWLDLAILYCGLGDAAETESLLSEIERRFMPPPSILEIIGHIRAQGCRGHIPTSRSSFTLGLGYDSNANQGASESHFDISLGQDRLRLEILPQYMKRGDRFYSISAAHTLPIGNEGTLAFVQAHLKQFGQMRDYDTLSAQAGLERGLRWHDWQLMGSVLAGSFVLGGSPYLHQARVQFRAIPPLDLPAGWYLGVTGMGTWTHYPSMSAFDSQVYELRGFVRRQTRSGEWQLSLGPGRDRASGSRPGDNRAGFSVILEGRRHLGNRLLLNWELDYQSWRASSPYSPGLIPERQHQRTTRARAGLRYLLDEQNAFVGEVIATDNRDRIAPFAYRSNVLFLGWQRNL